MGKRCRIEYAKNEQRRKFKRSASKQRISHCRFCIARAKAHCPIRLSASTNGPRRGHYPLPLHRSALARVLETQGHAMGLSDRNDIDFISAWSLPKFPALWPLSTSARRSSQGCPKGQYRTDAVMWLAGAVSPGSRRGRLSMTIHCWIGSMAEMSGGPASRSCRDLVDRAEALALAEPDEPLHIAALCCALAVSERTLRKAFHKIYGLPPHRHLRLLRLAQARGALLAAGGQVVTVTEIATGFGFVELGRFSVEYRKMFGESPSKTLQRSSSPKLCTQVTPRPGHFMGGDI
jgi:AraC-like DNA-binding protein